MQSFLRFALAGLLAGSAIAQSNAGLPSCAANGCVTSDYGGCEALDIECICTQGDWIAGLACCVSTACDADGQEATIQFANAICGSVGKADALPTTATCAATASSTAAASSAASSGTATASSGASSVTSAPSSTSTSSDSSTTDSASSGTATASASATTTAGDSGANAYKAQGAGLILGLVGFFAAL